MILFRDRHEAALKLTRHLEKYKNEQAIVLAVPRGGVPIGYDIAKNYNFPLELLMTKKIGHPLSVEFAIGAVSLEDYTVDNRYGIPESYIESEICRIRGLLKERYKKFMNERKPIEVENKVVLIVDDGIATGNTLMATIKMIQQKLPKKIIIAVPVAPYEVANKMMPLVDEFICLYTPKDFIEVAQFYLDFSEVTDNEVIELLADANRFGAVA